MPNFYHYTDEAGAQNILRSGKILASLDFMARGDTAFGNGVYLTKLSPGSCSKTTIAMNNWMSTSAPYIHKMKYYFVIHIPESDVKDTKAKGRNIFLYGQCNDLRLIKYPWWLKSYDKWQTIIASYKYHMMSLGPASRICGKIMGDYVMTEETVNGRPVYKLCKEELGAFLYMNSGGKWCISPQAGANTAKVLQESNYSLGPDHVSHWQIFYTKGSKTRVIGDATVKVHAWQM